MIKKKAASRIRLRLRDFQRYLSPHIRTVKPVVHISLNPHPNDITIMKFTAVHEDPLTFD